MSGREGGVVEWADYAALKAQSADYEARIKELEQDVDEDAAAIQQLEQVLIYPILIWVCSYTFSTVLVCCITCLVNFTRFVP